ncbi:hypothetical protein GCM10011335_38040 [Aureimonas glaciei]|uniref:HTH luxR-type domain-containing protein n=1 Tax=Aureimonas glaciei TaxID=1776957 RepID=A0A917DDK6_9HYPH|nr:hypothetical protein GCM10011335_38040 [Aureimonas glaciei]
MDLKALMRGRYPKHVLACLQLIADGFTAEEAAKYLGLDVEFVEDCLDQARRRLLATSIEHSVARAIKLGLIV